MAVFRIERTRDYTVMSNHHLRNANLSLKAKGLLSMMLSLPEDWNYTTRGLAKICKEGVDAIGAALRELEAAGYIVRHKLRDRQGRISDTEYVIYEQPQPKNPDTPGPETASPDTENPYLDKPDTEKPAELNIEKSNTQKSITQGASTDSIPFREPAAAQLPERKGRDAMSVLEKEIEIEKEREGETGHPVPAAYGRYNNVILTDTELSGLKTELTDKWEYYIDRLSCHIASTGKQYHSHAATIYKWAQEDAAKGKAAPKQGIPDYSCKEGESL